VYLNKKDPSYRERLSELHRMADDGIRHPRGVLCFKTFDEFNEFKEIFKKSTATESESPKNDIGSTACRVLKHESEGTIHETTRNKRKIS